MICGRTGSRCWLALILAGIASAGVSAPPGAVRASGGKPAAPIAIRHALAAEPALGRPLQVSIEIEPGVALEDVVVSLAGGEGLFVSASDATARIARIESGEIYRAAVSVTPLVLDVLYLTVVVDANAGGVRQARTALVAVRLAAEKSRSPATLKADTAGGGLVHSLPAGLSPSGRLR